MSTTALNIKIVVCFTVKKSFTYYKHTQLKIPIANSKMSKKNSSDGENSETKRKHNSHELEDFKFTVIHLVLNHEYVLSVLEHIRNKIIKQLYKPSVKFLSDISPSVIICFQ